MVRNEFNHDKKLNTQSSTAESRRATNSLFTSRFRLCMSSQRILNNARYWEELFTKRFLPHHNLIVHTGIKITKTQRYLYKCNEHCDGYTYLASRAIFKYIESCRLGLCS